MIKDCHSLKLLIGVSVWLVLLSRWKFSDGVQSDIDCLKSIQDSLQDPFNYLNSIWNFNNNYEGFICEFPGVECWHSDESRVLNIRLTDMGLKGPFPRGLRNCTSLVGLDLSSNELTGPIPDDIAGIVPFVTSLDLSNNNLSGSIPASLSECSYLNVLMLNDNKLAGVIPGAIGNLNRLRTFSFANNLLHGPVPKFADRAVAGPSSPERPERYANNTGLCGDLFPGKRCYDDNDGGSTVVPSIAGVCVAAVGFGVGLLLYVRKRNKKIGDGDDDAAGKKSVKNLEGVDSSAKVTMFERSVSDMELEDLLKGTDNFHEDNIIGRIGALYKAVLGDGTVLMVERLHDEDEADSNCGVTEFVSNVTALTRLKHPNLLPPSGFCIATARKERLLVYDEYMVNGSLYGNLHNRMICQDDEEGRQPMEWPIRLKIAKMSAKALSWLRLNNFIINGNFSHQPISSKRILLDAEFNPRILLNLPVDDTNINNDDPMAVGDVAVVYSFGNLLLELVTGEEEPLITTTPPRLRWRGGVGDYDDEVSQVLEVARSCVAAADAPRDRPATTMVEVYQLMRGIGKPKAGDDDQVIVVMPSDHGQ